MATPLSNQQLIAAAQKFGTPLYVYNAEMVRDRYHRLLNCFPYKKKRFFYAMKANYNPKLLKILLEEGASIDTVSPGDVLLALKVGFSKEDIIFTANMITDAEMQKVIDLGVLFNIGSLSELERYGKLNPSSEVCIRLNPDVVAGHHEKVRTGGKDTKFGITLNKIGEVKKIAKKYDLKIVGIHEHVGSGIPETVDMIAGLKNILAVVKKEDFGSLRFVDFGGGFKIDYKEKEEERLELIYQEFGKTVVKLFKEFCQEFGKELEMYFEPGRYLVAESGHLLIQVTVLKENTGKNIVGTNSGFPQLIRPMFYDAYHRIRNLTNPKDITLIYDIAGNICETGDYFATEREMTLIREGDLLSIDDAGAYCYSMGGNYNLRPMPTEVIIDGEQMILARKALTNEELVERVLM